MHEICLMFNYFWYRSTIHKGVNMALFGLPTPTNISFFWGGGSLLLLFLAIQIVTGIVLSMNYLNSSTESFKSLSLLNWDVYGGWILRSLHAKGASFFFLLIYFHLGRGVFKGSFLKTKT